MIQVNSFQQYFFQSGQDLIKILRERPYIAPVYLVKIRLLGDSISLYFSTHTVNIAGITWENYIIDITSLDDEIKRVTSDIYNTNVKVTLRNDPYGSSSYLIQRGDTYPWLGAECTIYEAYREGDTFSGLSCINKYIIDEVNEIDTSKFTLNLCSKVTNIDDKWIEPVVNLTDYPYAYEDAGKIVPFLYGSQIMIPTVKTDWGANTKLVSAINASQTTGITLSESARFPNSGTVQIDDEKISYTGITSYVLTGVTRGVSGTTAVAHSATTTIWEVKSYYYSLVSKYPCTVDNVYAQIGNGIYRITSGVGSVTSGGRQYVRSTGIITVDSTNLSLTDGIGVSDTIGFSSTGASKNPYPVGGGGGWTNTSNAYDGCDATYAYGSGSTVLNVYFSGTSYGTITEQYFWIKYAAASGLNWKSGSNGSYSALPATGGDTVTYTVRKYSGYTNWDEGVDFSADLGGTPRVYEVWKEIIYNPTLTKSGSASKTGTVALTGNIPIQSIDNFLVMATSLTSNNPGQVIYHFLNTQLGISDSEIDIDSFTTAQSFYVANGYSLDTYVSESITPSKFLSELCEECRSTIQYIKGKWTLTVLPSSAPTSIATIDSTMVSGEYGRFVFGSSPKKDIKNSITASYKKAYVKMETESDWIKTVSTSDATSISKYGTYSENIEFNHIRNDTCATNLITFKLLQQKYPLLMLQFDVFWEYVNLLVGDTITITNGLYNNMQFYVEKIDRTQQGIKISAIQWY